MRRLFTYFFITVFLLQYLPTTVRADGGFYLVSAYYSPEEGQDFYLHGNYEDEIRMNGEGKTTASGAPVRIGTIAAPKSVPFNTRISVNQNITIKGKSYDFNFQGTVLDRGGAINTASKLPRLDIYMGSGQKWLCRAINFWVQTVYATLDNSTIGDTSNFDFIPSDCNNPGTTTVKPPKSSNSSFDPFTSSLSISTTKENLKTVQRLLQRMNALVGDVDGVYDQEFRESVYKFQTSQWILSSWNDEWAGVYGPKTRSKLRAVLQWDTTTSSSVPPISTTPNISPDSLNNTPSPTITDLDDSSDSTISGSVFDGAKNSDIREIQKMLIEMGYFKYEVDGLYNKRLVDAILEFQLAKKIVTTQDDIGAGYYGPVTQSSLEEGYQVYLEKKAKIDDLKAQLETLKMARAGLAQEKRLSFEKILVKIPALKSGQIHPEIRTLQKLLKEYWYLDHKDTAIFWPLTKNSLARYQFDLKVIDSLTSPYAGVLGEKTKQAIVEDMIVRWQKSYTSDYEEVQKIENEITELSKK